MEIVLKRIKKILQNNFQYYLDIIFDKFVAEDTQDYGGSIYEKIPDENIEYVIGECDLVHSPLMIQIIGDTILADSRGYSNETEIHSVSILVTMSEDLQEKTDLRIKRYARAILEILRDYPHLRDPITKSDCYSDGIMGQIIVKYNPAIANDSTEERKFYLLQSFEILVNYKIKAMVFTKNYNYYNKNLS